MYLEKIEIPTQTDVSFTKMVTPPTTKLIFQTFPDEVVVQKERQQFKLGLMTVRME